MKLTANWPLGRLAVRVGTPVKYEGRVVGIVEKFDAESSIVTMDLEANDVWSISSKDFSYDAHMEDCDFILRGQACNCYAE